MAPPKSSQPLVDPLRDLRNDIERHRQFNIDRQWWLPTSALDALLTHDRVERILAAIPVNQPAKDPHHNRVLIKTLPADIQRQDDKIILALLVKLKLTPWITNFLKESFHLPLSHGSFQNRGFDKLGSKNLELILGEQYHFIETDMRLGSLFPRVYSAGNIMPFMAEGGEEYIQQGSFGIVQRFSCDLQQGASKGHVRTTILRSWELLTNWGMSTLGSSSNRKQLRIPAE